MSFNTASGRYYCNYQQQVCSQKNILKRFNTASGRYYCNVTTKTYMLLQFIVIVSIPQAVGTIAIVELRKFFVYGVESFNTASGRYYCNVIAKNKEAERIVTAVSIPQAVGTIAITKAFLLTNISSVTVSIPQAVGTIAIDNIILDANKGGKFQYRKRQVLLQLCQFVHLLLKVLVSIPQAVGTIAIYRP